MAQLQTALLEADDTLPEMNSVHGGMEDASVHECLEGIPDRVPLFCDDQHGVGTFGENLSRLVRDRAIFLSYKRGYLSMSVAYATHNRILTISLSSMKVTPEQFTTTCRGRTSSSSWSRFWSRPLTRWHRLIPIVE